MEKKVSDLALIRDYAAKLVPPEINEIEQNLRLPPRSLFVLFREKFRFIDLMERLPVTIFQERPGKSTPEVRQLNPGKTLPYEGKYQYQTEPDRPPRGLLWAYSNEEYDIEVALRKERFRIVEERFADSEYKTNGGILLTNATGGLDLDPDQRETTSKHLLAQIAISQRYLNLQPDKMAKHWIIQPLIYQLFEKQFNELYRRIGQIIIVANLSREADETAKPLIQLLEQLGTRLSDNFISDIETDLKLLAHAAADPEKNQKIIEVLIASRSQK